MRLMVVTLHISPVCIGAHSDQLTTFADTVGKEWESTTLLFQRNGRRESSLVNHMGMVSKWKVYHTRYLVKYFVTNASYFPWAMSELVYLKFSGFYGSDHCPVSLELCEVSHTSNWVHHHSSMSDSLLCIDY